MEIKDEKNNLWYEIEYYKEGLVICSLLPGQKLPERRKDERDKDKTEE